LHWQLLVTVFITGRPVSSLDLILQTPTTLLNEGSRAETITNPQTGFKLDLVQKNKMVFHEQLAIE
jgi:hypothetical protein